MLIRYLDTRDPRAKLDSSGIETNGGCRVTFFTCVLDAIEAEINHIFEEVCGDRVGIRVFSKQ